MGVDVKDLVALGECNQFSVGFVYGAEDDTDQFDVPKPVAVDQEAVQLTDLAAQLMEPLDQDTEVELDELGQLADVWVPG